MRQFFYQCDKEVQDTSAGLVGRQWVNAVHCRGD